MVGSDVVVSGLGGVAKIFTIWGVLPEFVIVVHQSCAHVQSG